MNALLTRKQRMQCDVNNSIYNEFKNLAEKNHRSVTGQLRFIIHLYLETENERQKENK
jgi:hypothetical protein